MDNEEARKLIRRDLEELWHTQQREMHRHTSHPHRVSHMPGGVKLHGPEEHNQAFSQWSNAFSDIHRRIDHLVVEGDMAAARVTSTGKHTGEFMGIPPTGTQVTLITHNIFRFEGDRIAEMWVEFDRLGILQQLGLPLPTK